jgi:hypothetical protein
MGSTYADAKGTAGVGDGVYYNSGIIIGSNWLTNNLKPTGTTIACNSIYGNVYGLYVRDYANLSLGDPSVLSVTAENNWWGNATGADHSSNPHGTGQGGDAVSDNVDFTPWYATSTTTSSTENVEAVHNPTIAWSDTIQGGIDAALDGDTINVAAETYDEQVVIDKALTLQGVGDTTIISPSQTTASGFQLFTRYGGGSTAGIIVANAGGASVTVNDLKVDGELITSTPGSARLIGIFYRETGGTIDNVTVEDVTVETGNGAYLSAETQTVSVEVKNSTFTNYQKNGIDANGPTLTANIHDNTVTGRGPLSTGDHCQNGIVLQFSEGNLACCWHIS